MKVMNTVWFVVPLLGTTFGFAACASAQIYYPWCANYGGGDDGGGTNCGFSTYEQCMATISGIGGFCDPNPFYTPPSQKPSRHQYKRHN
jgi:hypothetical protein